MNSWAPVALHAAADDAAIQHVQCSEQGGGTVAPIVMRHGAVVNRLSGRPGCVRSSAWIWLFDDRHHHRMGRRINIEADDIAQLLGKLRIGGQLEMARPVWLQAMGAPDALHRADADAAHLCHGRGGPVRGLTRRISQRECNDLLDHIRRQRRDARGSGLVTQQPVHPCLHEPFLPAPDSGLGHPGLTHDRCGAVAVGRHQHDPGTPNVLLRAVALGDDGEQPLTIVACHVDADFGAHALASHNGPRRAISFRMLPLGFIH